MTLIGALLGPAGSGAWADDVAGSQDYPLLGRYQGSEIVGYEVTEYDETTVLDGPFDPVDNSGAIAAPRLRAWVESFPAGDWASVCNADYTPFFHAAISVIDAACEDFVPPG